MIAAIVNWQTGLVSQVGPVDELTELEAPLRWLTENDWVTAPRVGQLWQGNHIDGLPVATFINDPSIHPIVQTYRDVVATVVDYFTVA